MPRFVRYAIQHVSLSSQPTGNFHLPSSMTGLAVLAVIAMLAVAYLTPRLWVATPIVDLPITVLETSVPTAPVETLDRTDLGARIANTGESRMTNLSAEMTVASPDGQVVMHSRQASIAIDPHETRTIEWMWRVPGQVPSGVYRASVVVTNADGSRVASSESSPASFVVVAR
jgi:hypothetical protein